MQKAGEAQTILMAEPFVKGGMAPLPSIQHFNMRRVLEELLDPVPQSTEEDSKA